jgi:hypothetical protein
LFRTPWRPGSPQRHGEPGPLEENMTEMLCNTMRSDHQLISARVYIIVLTARIAFQVEETLALVEYENIATI